MDAHVGFTLMMVRWPSPWPAVSGSTLNGLTLAQFFLAWAWEENEAAETYLASAGSSAHAEVVDAYGIESNSPHGSASSWLNTS